MMNELQKNILNIIQANYPLVARPFKAISGQLGVTESDVICAIEALRQTGEIRRIGAIFSAAHLGYCSTLVAAKVPLEQVDAFVATVNAISGVSHNYGRRHAYNVWFTMTMPSYEIIDGELARLRAQFKIREIYSLPAERLFKIKVDFDMNETPDGPADGPAASDEKAIANPRNSGESNRVERGAFLDWHYGLIRELQEDVPVIREPFSAIAERLGQPVDAVLAEATAWKASGIIRRFGASVRHHKIGFRFNGMAVFSVAPERVAWAGELLAGYKQVSHCYQRPKAPDWPYNLFAMTHSRSESHLHAVINEMVEKINPLENHILFTTNEYKKTNVKYFIEDNL